MNTHSHRGPGGEFGPPRRIHDPRTHPVPPTTAIVVGFDRQPSSRAALLFAIGIAAPLNAHLSVVHITDLDDFPVDPDSPDYEASAARIVATERDDACRLLGAGPAPWTYSSERGAPTTLLARKADEVDALMIVVGASRGGAVALIERLAGSSVSSALSHHSHRPVVVVPA